MRREPFFRVLTRAAHAPQRWLFWQYDKSPGFGATPPAGQDRPSGCLSYTPRARIAFR